MGSGCGKGEPSIGIVKRTKVQTAGEQNKRRRILSPERNDGSSEPKKIESDGRVTPSTWERWQKIELGRRR